MADYFVKPNGSDNLDGKSRANAFEHIWKGVQALTRDDRLIVMAGDHPAQQSPSSGGLGVNVNKSGVTIIFETDAIWNQNYEYDYGFYCGGYPGSDDLVFDGVVLRKTGAGFALRGRNIEIRNSDVRETNSHAVSINDGCDLIYIHNNYFESNDQTASARSCISVYALQDSGLPLRTEENGTDGWTGGWGVIVVDNVTVHTGYNTGNNADGNGVIIDVAYDPDKAQSHTSTSYTRHILVARNICVDASGCGIKVMMSRYAHVFQNTCYSNKWNTQLNANQPNVQAKWQAEIANFYSGYGFYRENIMSSTRINGGVFAACSDGGAKNAWAVDNNVYDRNLMYNSTSGAVSKKFGNTLSPPVAAASPGNDGYFLADPLFENPLVTSAGAAIGPAACDVFRARFRLQSTSPAKGISRTVGKDIGAVQTTVTPPVDTFTLTTPGVMTIGGDPIGGTSDNPTYPVGAPVTFTAATYSSTPDSRSFIVQWWNGAVYETKTATITGPVGGVYTVVGGAPTVTAVGGLRLRETGVKAGFTTLNTPTNWINIGPSAVPTGTAPVNTSLPTINFGTGAAPVVGVTCVGTRGVWTGDPAPSFVEQWQADGVDISGATGLEYVPVVGDEDKALTLVVTASNASGIVPATSVATPDVVASQPDDDLAGLTLRVTNLESEITAMRTDMNTMRADFTAFAAAQATRDEAQDGRASALEGTMSGVPDRVTNLETAMQSVTVAVDGVLALDQRVASLESIVGTGDPEIDQAPLLGAKQPIMIGALRIGETGPKGAT